LIKGDYKLYTIFHKNIYIDYFCFFVMKLKCFLLVMLSFVFLAGGVFAIDLDVRVLPVSNSVITDLNEPAFFDLVINNNGDAGDFEIYSLVGVDISPEKFYIDSGETKFVRILVMPQSALQSRKGFFTFEYLIKNSVGEVQKETLTINIVDLESSFDIVPSNINPSSEKISVLIKNKVSKDFNEVKIKMTSGFFDYSGTFSLNALEVKEVVIPLVKEDFKNFDAGSYLVNSVIEVEGKKANKEVMFRFLEQDDLYSEDIFSGWIKRQEEIVRHNVGNVKKKVSVRTERNFISVFFTSFNLKPSDSGFSGFGKYYVWEKELVPNEELRVVITTNWFYPVFIILLIIGVIYLIRKVVKNDLILIKKVSFVKTKGGQFALKVMLRVKSKGFVERISIVDKLPHLVNLYDKFGAIAPDDIDLKNRRIEWGIESLNKGEERVFSYIIYSKIGVIGRFELPSARAVYEREGRVKEVSSNRAFYINESGE